MNLEIKHSRVRRRPRTGLGNNYRVNKGVIYLTEEWLDVSVVVIKKRQYRDLLLELERRRRVINQAKKTLERKTQ